MSIESFDTIIELVPGHLEVFESPVALEVRAIAEGDQCTGCIFPQAYRWRSACSSIGIS